MALPDSLAGLLEATAYPHACGRIELIETHISWVVLTGDYAYKLKKPVRFDFLDFSTPALREHFCREELRCNRAFAPELYLDVVPVIRRADGALRMGGHDDAGDDVTVIEWCVRMLQFDPAAQLDRMLDRNAVTPAMLAAFGRSLAATHATLPRLEADAGELDARIFAPVRDNFTAIAATTLQAPHAALLEQTRAASEALGGRCQALLAERLASGHIRECHGDLHLSNLALINNVVTAFDCLEFNPTLRWIDPLNDAAFLFMDCAERHRDDLAYAFVNAYLDASGDYRGAELLTYYAAYRSMVRAKVAALRYAQEPDTTTAARFVQHVEWAHACLHKPPGLLVLMCGLSGSGKSTVAERLAPQLPALHLRSDVARKTLAGLDTLARTDSPVGGGLYAPGRSDAVFAHLEQVAGELLQQGVNVIVDATFIDRTRREPFMNLAARLGATVGIVVCDAPVGVLRERIAARARHGADASEATAEVLDAQLEKFSPPGDDEPVVHLPTGQPLDDTDLAALATRLRAFSSTIIQV